MSSRIIGGGLAIVVPVLGLLMAVVFAPLVVLEAGAFSVAWLGFCALVMRSG